MISLSTEMDTNYNLCLSNGPLSPEEKGKGKWAPLSAVKRRADETNRADKCCQQLYWIQKKSANSAVFRQINYNSPYSGEQEK